MQKKSSPPAFLIAGATASGKTALALDLAERVNGEIFCADSLQLYADLPILTARPTPEEEACAPHRLFGSLGPTTVFSVAKWVDAIVPLLHSAFQAGKTPIIVGGTGLYFKALTEGLSPIPEISDAIRSAVRALAEDGETLREALRGEDPVMASRLAARDLQRQARALEVIRGTGRSLANWQNEKSIPPIEASFIPVLLDCPREELYARCEKRFDLMCDTGAIDEVAALKKTGLERDAPVMKALGAKEIWNHLDGICNLDSAKEEAKKQTRRYAKRQKTWFRHQMNFVETLSTEEKDAAIKLIRFL